MTDKGYYPGLNPDGWRTYQPSQVVAGSSGGLTQPILDVIYNPYQFARYALIDKQLCIVQMNMSVLGNTTAGSGGNYCWSLPFPALRATPGAVDRTCIGRGIAYISFASAGNYDCLTPLAVTLADPFTSLGGQEDRFFQAHAPYILDWGTGTLPNGSGTVTITHNVGFAPNAQDIEVVYTASAGVTATKPTPRITNITSTTFDVSLSATAVSDMTLSWKIRSDPQTGQQGALVSPLIPYNLSVHTAVILGNFMNWFFHLVYPIAS